MTDIVAQYSITDTTRNQKVVFTLKDVTEDTTLTMHIDITKASTGVSIMDRTCKNWPLKKALKTIDTLRGVNKKMYSPQLNMRGQVEVLKDISEEDRVEMVAMIASKE